MSPGCLPRVWGALFELWCIYAASQPADCIGPEWHTWGWENVLNCQQGILWIFILLQDKCVVNLLSLKSRRFFFFCNTVTEIPLLIHICKNKNKRKRTLQLNILIPRIFAWFLEFWPTSWKVKIFNNLVMEHTPSALMLQ